MSMRKLSPKSIAWLVATELVSEVLVGHAVLVCGGAESLPTAASRWSTFHSHNGFVI